ncbi:UPF0149 family protein [Spartinivicinus poritis]|uniref:UPF0149 family protein n=1 Tax=Spartinivicinus poritis TaxID=2994640 RepID=A0ABT5U9M2_9GAMM|nr:UPF0149 family protein [Spartinivicinus sp. A2-2]MDE1463057.1 UPF0149 family protein [Spartinivicinus sp. A2-2]
MPFNKKKSSAHLSHQQDQLAKYLSQHEGCMSQSQLEGFIFAISCCPDSHIGNSWQHQVLPKVQLQVTSSVCCQLIGVLDDLFSHTQQQVLGLTYQLPITCIPEVSSISNFLPSSPFHQWSLGFMRGYLLTYELWQSFLPAENHREFSTAVFILGFFADQTIAEEVCQENNLGDFTKFCLLLLTKIPEAIDSISRFSLDLHHAITTIEVSSAIKDR